MSSLIGNPFRGVGMTTIPGVEGDPVSRDFATPTSLLSRCSAANVTPLAERPNLAGELGIARLALKDERTRMGLGSFKALGAAYAIAKDAARVRGDAGDWGKALAGRTYVCASAGNHGLSMAAGARVFGARAVVFLAHSVPAAFEERLRQKGADVVRAGRDYAASMAAAMDHAEANRFTLLSDSSWPGYHDPARDVMEGYLVMAAEAAEQFGTAPTHVFLQAGVGGLAAACTAAARAMWGDAPTVVVVEPDRAPALYDSISAGRPIAATGPASSMGRLDCKEPSHLALACLAREADWFMTISDEEAGETVSLLSRYDLETSPSGGAGVAGLHHSASSQSDLGLSREARVLAYVSEGPEGG